MRPEMSTPEEAPRATSKPHLRPGLGKTPLRRGLVLGIIIFGLMGALTPCESAEKPEKLYFSGRLIELDAAKHTFTVRSRNKELVFTIEPGRCDITVNGSMTERSLKWARIGDAVMGKLSLKEARPYVSWVEFTRNPQVGKPVAGKPGFLLSPYLSRWPDPRNRQEPMDARTFAKGDMVYDEISGKVFLVP